MAQNDGANFIKIVGIGVVIYLLMRKKIAPAMRKAASGGGSGGGGFASGNVPLSQRSQIAARVKRDVQALNITPIADEWKDASQQYAQELKECRI